MGRADVFEKTSGLIGKGLLGAHEPSGHHRAGVRLLAGRRPAFFRHAAACRQPGACDRCAGCGCRVSR
ncbi:protein of unknown function [Nitrospira japonica]|uniref:Uncharacterized protein n=1 Tax=Nitrospira japonica TaxID=1325564 RepID=A0A1W1I4I2_9BACT|nr:protein of unknown function [Nitrospira japonica]